MLTRTSIRDLLDRHGLSPSRALGQNFLCDPAMVDKIVRTAGIDDSSSVVEIGPGLGSLTLGLCRAGARVTAIEVDRYLVPPLSEVTADYVSTGQLTIVNADVLQVDWNEILGGSDRWSVVANLPYNIATPLILDLLAEQPALENWVVMVQREAGERLVAEPGSRIYGIPSVLVAFWAEARLAGAVPADVFLPRPNVESVLVKIDRRPDDSVAADSVAADSVAADSVAADSVAADSVADDSVADDYDRFAQLVRTAFGQRRKMLRRSLASIPEGSLEAAGIDPTTRPEQLGLAQWVALTKVVVVAERSGLTDRSG